MSNPEELEALRAKARSAFLNGDFEASEPLYQRYREQGGDDMGAILHLAICKEISGDKFSAKELYKVYGSREGGSHALRENIRGRALFQRNYPATASSYCDITINNAVVMSRLIGWGRFGNQVLEHFWMTLYSTNHGVKMAVSYWLGRDVFGLADYILTNAQSSNSCAFVKI